MFLIPNDSVFQYFLYPCCPPLFEALIFFRNIEKIREPSCDLALINHFNQNPQNSFNFLMFEASLKSSSIKNCRSKSRPFSSNTRKFLCRVGVFQVWWEENHSSETPKKRISILVFVHSLFFYYYIPTFYKNTCTYINFLSDSDDIKRLHFS